MSIAHRRLAVATAILLLVVLCRPPVAAAAPIAADPALSDPASELSSMPPDGVLVELKDGLGPAAAAGLDRDDGLTLVSPDPPGEHSGLYTAQVPAGTIASWVARLERDPRVASAEPNAWMAGLWNGEEDLPAVLGHLSPARKTIKPNDPLYKYQWHMQKIGVEEGWVGSTGKGVVVAVIDTGVAYENYGKFIQVEDLKGTRFVKGWNFLTRNEHANDDHGHGTHVAGTIAQTTHNQVGCVGVAYNATIMPLKVLSARGMGSVSDIAAAIRYAADHAANVINMSLGGPTSSPALQKACQYAHKKGVTIVCAAGNSNSENVGYPARYPECIAVSATRFDDQLTFYTNRGKRIDIAAPGGDMNVDQNDDGYKDGILQNTIVLMDPTQQTYSLYQGTSMASPHVAGAAALVEALGVTQPEAVRKLLASTARKDGLDLEKGYGGGVLDVSKAVFQSGFKEPLARFVLGVLLLGGLILLTADSETRRFPGGEVGKLFLWLPTPALLGGLILGSCGLFFLPWLGVRLPLLGFVEHAVSDWDLAFAGVSQHANPLFWSALIPLGVCVATFGQKRLQEFALGLCAGTAGFLLHQAIYTTAHLQVIPGMLLDRLWLVANAAVCLFLAYVLAFARPAPAADPEGKVALGEATAERAR